MKSLIPPLVLAAAVLAAAPAAAQIATDSDAPVDIVADEMEVVNSQCSSVWRGNAEALQGNTRLRANVLRTFFQPKAARAAGSNNSCGDLTRVEAEGSVYYVTPQQRVRGDTAVYDMTTDTIVMTGDVVAAQGQNVLRGARMVINVKTGEGRMVGAAKGRNQQARPRGVFFPNENRNAAR